MKLHLTVANLSLLLHFLKPRQQRCLPCLLVSRPGEPPTGSWQWRSDACCETWLSYWLHRAPQQLVGLKRAQSATAKNVMWRSEQVWMSPKGYPSQDLCIIPHDGYGNQFWRAWREKGGKGWGGEGKRSEIARKLTVLLPLNVHLGSET